ncbi:alpha/beta fold hydrolase [Azospirillum sp. RWY-5-1]|uniref:Proline iminopeptidase n=1 Tax=Azospirillum oleiclasticum TaxID=2735135 RepID=A0ABX2T4K8_9PROT|nr:alpha/beta fold hydrolase [Azospirillum oleiclasticum]NYZ11055.1 alpha/beta fold hydrolase [Azospirillum oleiclasticum]NYZ18217.1 alpha/beta fold hydrolase [Azospirillum oleiclasticum]
MPPGAPAGGARRWPLVAGAGLAVLALAAGGVVMLRDGSRDAPPAVTAAVAPPPAAAPPTTSPTGTPAAPTPAAMAPPPVPSEPVRPAVGRLTPADCPPLPLPGPAARCAHLHAALDWQRPDGTAITMFVTVLPSLAPAPVADPLLVLSGGPGQAGSAEAAVMGKVLEPVRRSRDVILVDQRGTGRSTPALRCDRIGPATFWYGGLTADAVRECFAPLRAAGIDLSHFDTRQSARDLLALRHALGIERWNLLATSYGAVLAQALLRIDAAAVRSLVLNSPSTVDATWLDLDRFRDTRRAFDMMAEDCAAQPDCARAYPNIRNSVAQLAKTLTDRPLLLRTSDAGGDAARTVGWDAVAPVVGFRLGAGAGMTAVPALLDRLDRMATGRLPNDATAVRRVLLPDDIAKPLDELAYGLNLVIGCRENRPRVDAGRARAEAAALHPFVAPDHVETDYDVACPVLGLPPVDPSFYDPVVSDAPALILTGAYDTLVARSRVDGLRRTLTRSVAVSFRGVGHDVLGASACAGGILAAFVEAPGSSAPPKECAERFLPPAFDLPSAAP